MFIKYLPNYRKLDSINGVGLWWDPGQVRNVSPEVAEKLCSYSDTWAKADDEPFEMVDGEEWLGDEVGLTQAEKPVEEPLPVIDFHGMNKKALIEFAETKYNERLDKRQNEESIRHKVIALFSKNEMEQR